MAKGLKSVVRYRLVVSPTKELMENGYFMAQTLSDHDIAVRLYKEFVTRGMACMLTAFKVEDVRVDFSDNDVARIMGLI